MSIEAMKQALKAFEVATTPLARDRQEVLRAQAALRQAIEQAEKQEPVAWMLWLHGPAGLLEHKQLAELEFERRNKEYPDENRKLVPLYTTPQPQREWVDLTSDEIWEVYKKHGSLQYKAFARAIEKALKEKNT